MGDRPYRKEGCLNPRKSAKSADEKCLTSFAVAVNKKFVAKVFVDVVFLASGIVPNLRDGFAASVILATIPFAGEMGKGKS
jgi:hypothetical protein